MEFDKERFSTPNPLARALVLTADEFEDFELFVPYFRMMEEGVAVDVAAPAKETLTGAYLLVSADLVAGRRLTSFWGDGVPDEIKAAGGIYVDEDVVVDGNLITSRWPMDLPAFMREVMRMLRKHADRRGRSQVVSSLQATAQARGVATSSVRARGVRIVPHTGRAATRAARPSARQRLKFG